MFSKHWVVFLGLVWRLEVSLKIWKTFPWLQDPISCRECVSCDELLTLKSLWRVSRFRHLQGVCFPRRRERNHWSRSQGKRRVSKSGLSLWQFSVLFSLLFFLVFISASLLRISKMQVKSSRFPFSPLVFIRRFHPLLKETREREEERDHDKRHDKGKIWFYRSLLILSLLFPSSSYVSCCFAMYMQLVFWWLNLLREGKFCQQPVFRPLKGQS